MVDLQKIHKLPAASDKRILSILPCYFSDFFFNWALGLAQVDGSKQPRESRNAARLQCWKSRSNCSTEIPDPRSVGGESSRVDAMEQRGWLAEDVALRKQGWRGKKLSDTRAPAAAIWTLGSKMST
jgi:hypothetical protein